MNLNILLIVLYEFGTNLMTVGALADSGVNILNFIIPVNSKRVAGWHVVPFIFIK